MTNNQLKPDPDISTQKIIFINAKYILLILRHGLFPQSFKGKCAVFVGRMDPRKTLRHLTQAHLISQQPIGSNQFSSFVCNQGCAEKCQYISNNFLIFYAIIAHKHQLGRRVSKISKRDMFVATLVHSSSSEKTVII